MNVSVAQLAALQRQQDRIRNFCIMAHVDHGKTTLSDHLIASNGLIHPKMVGELRYLDSRDDEQARGITMKSSSISLLHVPGAANRPEGPRGVPDAEKVSRGYLVNLIDSPGHVDFCSEVSTAARLSDGALVVVDAVEGVCIQTHAVLRQAWEERVRPCLMINKLDRLILELRLSPSEAAARLSAIVHHANMIWSAFDSEAFLSEADAVLAYEQQRQAEEEGGGGGEGEGEDGAAAAAPADQETEDAFRPSAGNVAFGSAADGWAFTLPEFAAQYAEKLGAKPAALCQALWGDYTFQAKDKRVVRLRRAPGSSSGPRSMFEQFALEPLWKAYTACDAGSSTDAAAVLAPIVKGRGLGPRLPPRALEATDPRQALRAVLRAWLPLSEAVLGMAVEHLPSPPEAAPWRMPRLLGGPAGAAPPLPATTAAAADAAPAPADRDDSALWDGSPPPGLSSSLERLRSHLAASSSAPEAPLVIYVSKMVSIPANLLPRRPGDAAPTVNDGHGEVFLAFGRVFSGIAREGARVHVLTAAYDPALPRTGRQTAVLRGLYLMMGRALERLPAVPAGNVLAIAGLESAVLKSATLASTPAALPLAPMQFQAAPIVRVALEPARPSDMPALAEGLRLLNRADPFVEVGLTDKGEQLLGAAGEVHLETCVKDLRERFARVEFQVSPPLVAFRESVFCADEAEEGQAGKPARIVEASTPSGACTVRVRAHALPGVLATALDDSAALLKQLLEGRGAGGSTGALSGGDAVLNTTDEAPRRASFDGAAGSSHPGLAALRQRLATAAGDAAGGKQLTRLLQRAWLLGPKRIGPNMLLSFDPSAVTFGACLFDATAASVVRTTSRHTGGAPKPIGLPSVAPAGAAAALPADAAAAAGDGTATVVGELAIESTATVPVPLGHPDAAEMLGLLGSTAGSEEATTAPADGVNSAGMVDEDGTASNGGGGGSRPSSRAGPVPSSSEADASFAAAAATAAAAAAPGWQHVRSSIESGVVAGFSLAAAAGPLMDEPLWGVAFEVEARVRPPTGPVNSLDCDGQTSTEPQAFDLQEDVYGPFSGQVMTAVAAACRQAVLEADSRLVEALFLCQVQAAAEALSGVYAVLGRRRARILREELREGSGAFLVHAYLPVEASFGLADEMRRRSSGAASASLLLSHWERLQVDPFFVPTTEEELEEYGTEAGGPANLARRLVDAVRRRKGLPVEEKVVKVATKQRTLKRNV